MKRLKRRKKRTGFGWTAVVVLFICGVISYKRLEANARADEYAKQIAQLEKDLQKEEERSDEIKEQEAYMQTKKYYEDVAREKLGLCYENEIIFKAEDN